MNENTHEDVARVTDLVDATNTETIARDLCDAWAILEDPDMRRQGRLRSALDWPMRGHELYSRYKSAHLNGQGTRHGNHGGHDLPDWDDLKGREQGAWDSLGKQLTELFQDIAKKMAEKESGQPMGAIGEVTQPVAAPASAGPG
jgi:hypothetical protein